ncbi:ankyrin repeat domain-containing protein [Streptomyces katrae]|uniref:ankyrin repeat domain-containing protein n=1 Tax=Streptomyces katrae TaxID=68223 RepID=UPI001F333882|nr:ankyrin repeat domain-containing protein [Streptomyces katrae]
MTESDDVASRDHKISARAGFGVVRVSVDWPARHDLGIDMVNKLTRAVEDGDAAAVARLLGGGVEVDAPDMARRTALELAVKAGHVEIVRLLLAAGADPHQQTGEYEELTPLLQAVTWGHTSVVRALLDAGAPSCAQGKMSWLPLVVVPDGERGREIVDLLLDRGADVNGLMKGWTPLEWAAAGGQVEMVRQLLARGATSTAEALSRAYARGNESPEGVAKYAAVINALRAADLDAAGQ